MGLFSKEKVLLNLNLPKNEYGRRAPNVEFIRDGKLEREHEAVFLLGSMHHSQARAIMLSMHFALDSNYRAPDGIIWAMTQTLASRGLLHSRYFAALSRDYSLYELRTVEPMEDGVTEFIRTAKRSLKTGRPVEFLYESERSLSEIGSYGSAMHCAQVISLSENGFRGITARGIRNFSWHSIEHMSILGQKSSVESEKAIHVTFRKERETGYIRLCVGTHRGKGKIDFEHPAIESLQLPYGTQ